MAAKAPTPPPAAKQGKGRKPISPPLPKTTEQQQPSADLVTLAGTIPAEILQQISTAIQTGHCLLAVWYVKDGQVELRRTAIDFPTIDLDLSVKLLGEDLQKLKAQP